jgi:hypothetical protein
MTSWRVHQIMLAPIKSRGVHVAGIFILAIYYYEQ